MTPPPPKPSASSVPSVVFKSEKLSREVMQHCAELAKISEDPTCLTRTFASPAMKRANALASSWMRAAGMETRVDAAFNLIGRLPSARRGAKCLLIGSHLDTVRNAGKYDGPLGVLLGVAVAKRLRGTSLPFHLEVIGFSDEEGVKYQTTYLGSRALCGLLRQTDLARIKETGLAAAKRPHREFLAYLEAHIEQGPVLEAMGVPVGVVNAIAGQTRLRVSMTGQAAHAGTTPMKLRHDALAGAAEVVLAAENLGVLATVGQLEVIHGASNVVPGAVEFTVDIRDADDAARHAACNRLRDFVVKVARKRGLKPKWKVVQETPTVPMDPSLTALLSDAVPRLGGRLVALPSGAGHDAAVLAKCCPTAMLFIRCRGGVSHHPAEAVKTADVAVALETLTHAVLALADHHG